MLITADNTADRYADYYAVMPLITEEWLNEKKVIFLKIYFIIWKKFTLKTRRQQKCILN